MALFPPSAWEGYILTGTVKPAHSGQGCRVQLCPPSFSGQIDWGTLALTRRKLFTVPSVGSRHDPLWLFRLRKGWGGLERPW